MRHSKKPRRGRGRAAPAEALFQRALLGFDDDSSSGRPPGPREDRKTLQLCRQVQRALAMALAGECADELLRDVYVDSVEPVGGAGHLRVAVVAPRALVALPAELAARLAAQTPRLRALVAREICRKRVPTLSFVVMPPLSSAPTPPDGEEGGSHG